jgi:hypothetical protein
MVGYVGPTFMVGRPMINIGTTFWPADDKHRHYILAGR